jgi:outer membrane protein assembly factor BamD (BamD/ComL family)
LSFAKPDYRQAYNFYDSLRLDDPTLKDVDAIQARKTMLGNLATNFEIAARQDSLQRIAGLPEDQRKDHVKKLVKELRKQQGLKDEPLTAGPAFVAPTLFPSVQPKGEWYFYNAAFRTRGQNDFKNKWGTRPNADNWRRSSTINAGLRNNQPGNITTLQGNANSVPGGGLTFEDLYANLPLTTEQLKVSNDSIQDALFALGKIYIQEIEDCNAGTQTLEQLRSRFPKYEKMDQVLFNLFYCYNKNGETAKIIDVKRQLSEQFNGSAITNLVISGKDPKASANSEATKTYERIYDLFIEGRFDQAVIQKRVADSQYGKNYWTPQLLYIEAVYYIKQRNDSTATTVLNNIISQFPSTPLAEKATNLLNVLSKRAQIEYELAKLDVTRNIGDTTTRQPVTMLQPKTDTGQSKPLVTNNNPRPDTLNNNSRPNLTTPFTFNANETYYVMVVLTQVDPVFCSEAKNAFARYNRETYFNKTITADLYEIDKDNRLLLMWPFKDAQEAVAYVITTRPKTATEILPWLRGGRYSLIIVTEPNLELLKANKDLDAYKAFLKQHLPGSF